METETGTRNNFCSPSCITSGCCRVRRSCSKCGARSRSVRCACRFCASSPYIPLVPLSVFYLYHVTHFAGDPQTKVFLGDGDPHGFHPKGMPSAPMLYAAQALASHPNLIVVSEYRTSQVPLAAHFHTSKFSNSALSDSTRTHVCGCATFYRRRVRRSVSRRN